jgi:hypothetical protein
VRNLLLFSAILAAGCAAPQPPTPELATASEHRREIIPPADVDGMVLIDWSGVKLEELFGAVANRTGKVFVFDRRELAPKPPVNISRVLQVPASAIYPLGETVASENGLGFVTREFALGPSLAADVIRIVPRVEATKGMWPVDFTTPDYFAAKDTEFLVAVGCEPTAGLVRQKIAGMAAAWSLQTAAAADYALTWEKRRNEDPVPQGLSMRHRRIREGEMSWQDLFRFSSPFPAHRMSFQGCYYGLGTLTDEDGDGIPDIRIPESARGLDPMGGLFRGASAAQPPISPTPSAPAR